MLEGKLRKIKAPLLNIIISIVIFSFFLVSLEITLRITHLFNARISWASPDPIVGFKFTPGMEYWFKKENDHAVLGRINSYGFRDKEWSIEKSENIYRVAVLGDSYVEAFQVESDRTFLSLTEDKLNNILDDNLRVELMNFGRAGYTQTQELLILKKDVLQFSPDMVLLLFLPVNDIQDVNIETSSSRLTPFYNISDSGDLVLDTSFSETNGFKIRSYINWFKQRSALISLIAERYNAYEQDKSNKAVNVQNGAITASLSKRIRGYMSLCTDLPDEKYAENYELNKRLIKAASEYSKEHGSQFMLITINTPAYVPAVEKKLIAMAPSFNANFFEDDLRDYAGLLGSEYLGLQRPFREKYEKDGVFLHWHGAEGHWNYRGHELVADSLSTKLATIIRSN